MNEHEAARTLVKSPPELWEVCSDASLLSRHLQAFGEIRITRLEPETTVAWEGERASGTVRIEPSGWGTRVTLTAKPAAPPGLQAHQPAVRVPVPRVAAPETGTKATDGRPAPNVAFARRRGVIRRLASFWVNSAVVPVPVPVDPEPEPIDSPELLAPPVAAPPESSVMPEPDPPAAKPDVLDALAALETALDSLGQDHHRPFSRG